MCFITVSLVIYTSREGIWEGLQTRALQNVFPWGVLNSTCDGAKSEERRLPVYWLSSLARFEDNYDETAQGAYRVASGEPVSKPELKTTCLSCLRTIFQRMYYYISRPWSWSKWSKCSVFGSVFFNENEILRGKPRSRGMGGWLSSSLSSFAATAFGRSSRIEQGADPPYCEGTKGTLVKQWPAFSVSAFRTTFLEYFYICILYTVYYCVLCSPSTPAPDTFGTSMAFLFLPSPLS